jgi:hypothetical protein
MGLYGRFIAHQGISAMDFKACDHKEYDDRSLQPVPESFITRVQIYFNPFGLSHDIISLLYCFLYEKVGADNTDLQTFIVG